MTKNIFLIICLSFIITNLGFGQIYSVPSEDNPIINITVPTDLWEFSRSRTMVNISPIESGEDDRLLVMLWASDNPGLENALDIITSDALAIAGSFLKNLSLEDESYKFTINNTSFIAIDGYGYYKNDDNSEDMMTTTIMLFLPDKNNIMALVYFATTEANEKWNKDLKDVINSITPVN